MVQQVVIPFSELNAIPGVAGLDDIEFSIPQVDDIVDPILDAIPDPSDIETAANEGIIAALQDATVIDEFVDALVDPLVEELEQALGIDFPSVDAIADAVADEIDTLAEEQLEVTFQGFFGPLAEDIEAGFEQALEDLIGFADDLPEDLNNIVDGINRIITQLDELDVPTTGEIADAITTETEAIITDALPVEFVEDPIGWIESNLLDVTPDIESDLEDRLAALEPGEEQ